MRRGQQSRSAADPVSRPQRGTAKATASARAQASPCRATVEVSNRQQLANLSRTRLIATARYVLAAQQVTEAHLGIALVADQEMQRLHREFLGIEAPTDVLTFPMNEPGEVLAGELVVSVETALREAPRHGLSTEHELAMYLIHGILHLCGYDDRTGPGARRMQRRQRRLLRELGFPAQGPPRK
jgi:probable rRNA maturation factor